VGEFSTGLDISAWAKASGVEDRMIDTTTKATNNLDEIVLPNRFTPQRIFFLCKDEQQITQRKAS